LRTYTKNKFNWRTISLAKVASDVLGLDHKEIIPDIGIKPGKRPPIREKYVTLSEHSTFQAKYWNYKNGWQIVVDYLNDKGYKVMIISKEKTNLKNVIDRTNRPIQSTITNIYHSEFRSLQIPVIMISGYSKEWAEFKIGCERIINKEVCNGCFNDINFPFDRGNWNFCPRHQGTPRQFECTKKIYPEMVIERINKILNIKE